MGGEHRGGGAHVAGDDRFEQRGMLGAGVAATLWTRAGDLKALRVIVQLHHGAVELTVAARGQQREVELAMRVEEVGHRAVRADEPLVCSRDIGAVRIGGVSHRRPQCSRVEHHPVPRAQKVFAIGLNYRSHAEESNMAIPPSPMTFTKFPTCLVGPTTDIVLSGAAVDWEVELVAVIGTGGRNISRDDAWSHVAGLTLGQDISDRVVQLTGAPPQFSMGKSFDTFGPIGPAVVSVDAFPEPDNVGLWCDVAGERMQTARSDDLIFSVPAIIEYLSAICTLTAGDLIFTGAPSGVGGSRGRFLQDGEMLDSGAEVIGTLHNRCVTQ